MRKKLKPLGFIRPLYDLQHPFAPVLRLLKQLAGVTSIGPYFSQPGKPIRQIFQNQLRSVTVLDVSRVNGTTQNQAQRIYDDVTLAPLYFLAGVVAARAPFSVVFTLWLSTIAALGLFLRPSLSRMRLRRVSWTFSQVPSSRHCLKYI